MELITIDVLHKEFLAGVMIFLRFGAMLMVMPGLGSIYVPVRIRLLLAVMIALLLSGSIDQFVPGDPISRFIVVFFELVVGFFLGLLCQILLTAMQMAGHIISVQSSLGSATIFDPHFSQNETIFGSFLYLLAICLFFTADIDHLLIKFLVESYNIINLNTINIAGDFNASIIRILSASFELALKFSGPIIIMSMLINIGGGILSKLMPNIQVFFLLTPVQILLSFMVLFLVIINFMELYMEDIAMILPKLLKGDK